MAEPLREQVLVALVNTLGTMTGVRPGFGATYRNPIRVERKLPEPGTQSYFPHLAVVEGALDGSASSVDVRVIAGGQIGLAHDFRVLLVGHVMADMAVLASTWRQRLWDDCLRTLWANSTLGGLVQSIDWGRAGMEPEQLTQVNIDGFYQPLSITFHETVTTD
jgi:hypothetical protein